MIITIITIIIIILVFSRFYFITAIITIIPNVTPFLAGLLI